MKQVLRYQALTVPGKLRVEVRLIVDDRGVESHFAGDSSQNVSISPRPFIVANIIRPTETDENGQRMRAPWDPADSLSMTKYTLPIFLEELRSRSCTLTTVNVWKSTKRSLKRFGRYFE